MRGVFRPPLRAAGRLAWLGAELALAALRFGFEVLPCPNPGARASWLRQSCRRVLRCFGTEVRTTGPIPGSGLLVSNHLSYLDILVLGALTPSVFVAKREVRGWPVFGWFARLAGTLFTDREKPTRVAALAAALEAALDRGLLVVLFPEGTSSDGDSVLPFKTSLLESAARGTHPLAACLIEYQLDDGDVGEEVCYWKDMTLVPHLINLLSKPAVRASVRFSEVRERSASRKALARQLRSEILRLKRGGGRPLSPDPPATGSPSLGSLFNSIEPSAPGSKPAELLELAAVAAGESEPGAVVQHHDILPLKPRLQFLDPFEVDEG